MQERRLRRTGALLFGLAACGGGGGSSGPPVTPPVVEASRCELPAPPDLGPLAEITVGDGTPASCTEAALRAALAMGGSVGFACGDEPVVIAVSAPLHVQDGTRVHGDGRVVLDGGGNVRILETANTSKVILEGLTFQHGRSRKQDGVERADGSGGAIWRGWQSDLYVKDCLFKDNVADGDDGFTGGAIFAGSAGWLTIVGSTFTGNRAPSGGATHTVLSDLTVVDSVFTGNEATRGDGGAIYTDGGYVPAGGENGAHGGKITLCGVRFTDNVATASAAAGFLYAYGEDQLSVNRCEFRDNRVTTAEPGLGGALRIDAIAFVNNTLFAENTSAGQGGALWIGRGPVTFENVTFFANHATLWGGAISYDRHAITLDSCTLAYNTAGEGSDGLFGGDEATPQVHNSIFFANGEDSAGDGRHCRHPIAASTTIVFPATDGDVCGAAGDGGILHADPRLATALADNGGFTMTLSLGDGSPALGAGTDCPATDQRGEPRDPSGCDLGAVEMP